MRKYGAVIWSKTEYLLLLSSLHIMGTSHGDIIICPKLLLQLCKPVVSSPPQSDPIFRLVPMV